MHTEVEKRSTPLREMLPSYARFGVEVKNNEEGGRESALFGKGGVVYVGFMTSRRCAFIHRP